MAEIELREIPLFSEMDEQEVLGIRAIMEEMKFKPGQVIIREGESGDLFYIITEGNAQIIIRDADGDEIVLREVGPGGFFGELSMLTNEPRSARVRALDHVTTLALERDDFFDFLRKHCQRRNRRADRTRRTPARERLDPAPHGQPQRQRSGGGADRPSVSALQIKWRIPSARGASSLPRASSLSYGSHSTSPPGSITGTRILLSC